MSDTQVWYVAVGLSVVVLALIAGIVYQSRCIVSGMGRRRRTDSIRAMAHTL